MKWDLKRQVHTKQLSETGAELASYGQVKMLSILIQFGTLC